jgi:hypothetical protein
VNLDSTTWLAIATMTQAFGAIVQAATAVVIVLLTRELVAITREYARTTRGQLAEATRMRLASVEPDVIALDSEVWPGQSSDRFTVMINLNVLNQGQGMAYQLTVRVVRSPCRFAQRDPTTLDLAPGGIGRITMISANLPSSFEQPELGRPPMLVLLEYRDIANRLWQTSCPAQLELDELWPSSDDWRLRPLQDQRQRTEINVPNAR